MEIEVAEEQPGFRQNRGTHNYLSRLFILTERACSHRQALCCVSSTVKKPSKVHHTRNRGWQCYI